mgnify:CR=1 FL=1
MYVDEGGHADQDEKNVFHFDPEEAEADEDVHNGGDVEAEKVHQEKEQEESGKHDPELFREKAVKHFGAVADDFVLSSVIPEQMAHADCRQKKEQADDKIRIVSCRFGKVQCQI